MIKCLKGIAILFGVILFTLAGVSRADASGLAYEKYAPVLVYNDIAESPSSDAVVALEAFKSHLDWLSRNGYKTLTLEAYIAGIKNGQFGEKDILLTFDGTYESLYQYVAPELAARNMCGTFFIASNRIDDKSANGKNYLTSQQVVELAKDKAHFSLGSNTYSHTDLTKLDKLKIAKELKYSKKAVEELAMDYCHALAYPMGKYNEAAIEVAEATHYVIAFGTFTKGDFGQDTRYSIPRIEVGSRMSAESLGEAIKAYPSL